MNLKQYLVGMFRGVALNGELEDVRKAARQDAEVLVGAYLSEFESTAARLFSESQQRLTEGSVDDAEWEPVDSGDSLPTLKRGRSEWEEYSRNELMKTLKSHGGVAHREDTKKDLIDKLVNL